MLNLLEETIKEYLPFLDIISIFIYILLFISVFLNVFLFIKSKNISNIKLYEKHHENLFDEAFINYIKKDIIKKNKKEYHILYLHLDKFYIMKKKHGEKGERALIDFIYNIFSKNFNLKRDFCILTDNNDFILFIEKNNDSKEIEYVKEKTIDLLNKFTKEEHFLSELEEYIKLYPKIGVSFSNSKEGKQNIDKTLEEARLSYFYCNKNNQKIIFYSELE